MLHTSKQRGSATLILAFLCITFARHSLGSRLPFLLEDPGSVRQRVSTYDSEPRLNRQALKGSQHLDLQTLRRGRIYAINVAPGAPNFQLLPVDVATVDPTHLKAGAASISAQLRSSYPDSNVGWAWYADTYSEDGWYRLEIRLDEDAPFPDVVKARAAGFVEGNLQGQHMYRYWTNYRRNEYRGRGEAPSQELYDFFDEQYGWMTKKVEAATGWTVAMLRGAETVLSGAAASASRGPANGDGGVADSFDRRYWTLVGLVTAQFEGLAAGFWASVVDSTKNMTWHELYTLNALGDLYELNVIFPPSAAAPSPPPPPAEPSAPEGPDAEPTTASTAAATLPVRQRHYTPGHGEVGEYGYGELLDCSAIIKIDDSGKEDYDEDEEDDSDDAAGGDVAADGSSLSNDPRVARTASRGLRVTASRTSSYLRRRGQGQPDQQLNSQQRHDSGVGSGGLVEQEKESEREGWWEKAGNGRPLRRVRKFWAAHNTWRAYFEMVRTWKVYDLPWASSGAVTVSSSPGLLHSKDDWYTTDQFVVMETTNGIYNKQLYDLIQPKCVLMWQRAQLANFGARSGSEWVNLFSRYNSGTYNNQWMVLDVPLLEAGRRDDVLWVLEQVPGTIISEDATRVLLDQGYWASYNVPYFPEIYNLTGYPHPSIYATCPRARIFQ